MPSKPSLRACAKISAPSPSMWSLNWMPGGHTLEELAQAALTLDQCQWPHVDAVELKQVEGVQERHAIVLATMQSLEVGDTRPIAHHMLAVDRRVLCKRLRSRTDQGITVGPIIAPAGEQAHAAVTPADAGATYPLCRGSQ